MTTLTEEQIKEIEEQQRQVKASTIQWINDLDLILSVDFGELVCNGEEVEITVRGVMKD